ncbi:SBBP repeat-containing protein [Candidatus Acetothermia bacterium]|nr:SBBP repeat-containing protein [Candidatus Acetothermia bacterium]
MTTRNSQVRGGIKWIHVRMQGLCGLMLQRSQRRLLANTSLGRLLVLFILLSVSSVYGISVSVGRVSYQPEFFDKASVVTPPTMAVAQSHLSSRQIMSQKDTDSQIQLARAYGKLPLSFEANQGQTDEQVSFLSQGKGYTLFLLRGEAVLALRKPTATEIGQPKDQIDSAELIARMKLIGANDQTLPAGEEELPGKVNYFLGNDRTKWHMNIATYAKVKYQGVYTGVDLLYYGNQGQLEYDFVIAPGADPKRIILGFEGIKGFEVNEQGNLMLQIPGGQIELHQPLIYQEIDGMRHEISSGYALKNNHQIGFEVGPYDHSKTLVIDPTLVYSTYLGGNGSDIGNAITVDSQGNAYITGATTSTNFPTLNPLQSSSGGVFVTKLDATGSTLMYSTYLGGNGGSNPGNGIAVDSQGNVYITGATNSTNFPTVNPLQSSFGGGLCGKVVLISGKGGDCTDAFVAKLNATGSKLVYSTYLGAVYTKFCKLGGA